MLIAWWARALAGSGARIRIIPKSLADPFLIGVASGAGLGAIWQCRHLALHCTWTVGCASYGVYHQPVHRLSLYNFAQIIGWNGADYELDPLGCGSFIFYDIADIVSVLRSTGRYAAHSGCWAEVSLVSGKRPWFSSLSGNGLTTLVLSASFEPSAIWRDQALQMD